MKDEDRRDNFLLYNPIEMSKLRDNYTVPSDVSECNNGRFYYTFVAIPYVYLDFISIKKKGKVWSHVRNICYAKYYSLYFAQEQSFGITFLFGEGRVVVFNLKFLSLIIAFVISFHL